MSTVSDVQSPRVGAAQAMVSVRPHWPLAAVATASGAWFVLIGFLALRLHGDFSSGRFDLGNMTQAVWSTAHGRLLETTMAGGEQMSRLAVHVDPILVVFAPFAYVGRVPEALILTQALALAAGAYPVYRLAVHHLASERAGVLLAIAYLVNPWIAWQALFDFHAVVLAIPLLLFAVLFLEEERWVLFAVFTGTALLTHELVGLSVAALGVWYAVRVGRLRVGSIVAAAGLCWTAVCLWVLIPAASSGHHSPFYGHFAEVGGSPAGLAKTLFTDPLMVLSQMSSMRDLVYVGLLLAPVAGLAVWAPTMLLVASPQLAVNMLASPAAMTSPGLQYSAAVVPFVFAATAMGLARFKGERRRVAGAGIVCTAAMLFFLLVGPVTVAPAVAGYSRTEQRPSEKHRDAMREAVSHVPSHARVAATNFLGAHLSERRVIYSIPVLLDADWLVLDIKRERFVPNVPGRVKEGLYPSLVRRFQKRIAGDPSWLQVFGRDGVFVYRRMQ